MLKYYELDSEGRIDITTDYGRVVDGKIISEQFDFPDDFDFNRQSYYRIINGELVEDTEALNAAVDAEKAEEIRDIRDALLKECDFTVLPDSPFTDEQRAAWIEYRQALRDIPRQLGFPFDIAFPKRPE